MTDYVLGIDLGTTYSAVSVYRNNKSEVIPNLLGKFSTPSIVAFTENERIIGDAAKNQIIRNYLNTVYDSKRLIGRQYSDKVVQEDKKLWPFKVENNGNDKPIIEVKYLGRKTNFYPEQISSMILQQLKENAEKYLGKKINDAVITVPAHFNDSQRQSTIDAAKIANINVLGIINEPTAAAINFGVENKSDKVKRNICILDLGGGTFDITIFKIDNNKFKVIATGGDSHLGGQDFDNELVKFCIKEFKKKNNVDISNNLKAVRRLKLKCEEIKIELSNVLESTIELDGLHEGEDFYMNINRIDFETCCKNLFERCINKIKETLNESKLSKNDIDEIVLVGGSTRIPKIQKLIKEFFPLNEKLNFTINADFSVALGASIFGERLKNNSTLDIEIKDVNPHSLGICSKDGKMVFIIPKNTNIPCSKIKRFQTIYDNQTYFGIGIYEGENPYANKNYNLDNFIIDNITQGPKGSVRMKVTFSLDKDSILTVTAEEERKDNKNCKTLQIKREKQSNLNINELILKEKEMKKNELRRSAILEKKHELESLINSVLEINNPNQQKIQRKARDLKEWLSLSQNEDFNVYESKILEMRKYMKEI